MSHKWRNTSAARQITRALEDLWGNEKGFQGQPRQEANLAGVLVDGRCCGAALGLAAHQRLERVLVFILELARIEMRRLGVEDVLGELDLIARQARRADVGEIRPGVAQFARVAQSRIQRKIA
jgi:hypothetical protein